MGCTAAQIIVLKLTQHRPTVGGGWGRIFTLVYGTIPRSPLALVRRLGTNQWEEKHGGGTVEGSSGAKVWWRCPSGLSHAKLARFSQKSWRMDCSAVQVCVNFMQLLEQCLMCKIDLRVFGRWSRSLIFSKKLSCMWHKQSVQNIECELQTANCTLSRAINCKLDNPIFGLINQSTLSLWNLAWHGSRDGPWLNCRIPCHLN